VTENLLTSIKASEVGMRTVYRKEQLSAGLAPEGIGKYVSQPARWGLGTMQIARSPLEAAVFQETHPLENPPLNHRHDPLLNRGITAAPGLYSGADPLLVL
jgi:hypothetical protein